jgi:hypothetical protein
MRGIHFAEVPGQHSTIQDAKDLLLFNDDSDLKKCSISMINLLTTQCLFIRILDEDAKHFVFHKGWDKPWAHVPKDSQ